MDGTLEVSVGAEKILQLCGNHRVVSVTVLPSLRGNRRRKSWRFELSLGRLPAILRMPCLIHGTRNGNSNACK